MKAAGPALVPSPRMAARIISAECMNCRTVFTRPLGSTAQRTCGRCSQRAAAPNAPPPASPPAPLKGVAGTMQRCCGAAASARYTLHGTAVDWASWDPVYRRRFGSDHDPHMAELIAVFADNAHKHHYGSFELQIALDRLAQMAAYDGTSQYAIGTHKASAVATLRQAGEYLQKMRADDVYWSRWWRTAAKATAVGWRFVVTDAHGNLGLLYHSIVREIVIHLGDLFEPEQNGKPGLINEPPGPPV